MRFGVLGEVATDIIIQDPRADDYAGVVGYHWTQCCCGIWQRSLVEIGSDARHQFFISLSPYNFLGIECSVIVVVDSGERIDKAKVIKGLPN
jgi:hypothetical protein